ncbi:MAG: copper amine oxidase N-terminal domain-containing protein [Turicibacter sp.]|nr:copper amine oxidase N-terminal domain-containing protein [Turicibacter sp.]
MNGRKMMKISIITLLILLAYATPTFASEATLRLEIGSRVYSLRGVENMLEEGQAPFIDPAYNRTMVPLRMVAETLDADVSWNDATRTVTIVGNNTTFILNADSPLPNNMGMPAFVNDRLYVPLAYIAEQLGFTATWDNPFVLINAPPNITAELPPPSLGLSLLRPTFPDIELVLPEITIIDPLVQGTETTADGRTPLELFETANNELLAAGSSFMQIYTYVGMTIPPLDVVREIWQTGTIAQVNNADARNIRIDLTTEPTGESTITFFRNNIMYTIQDEVIATLEGIPIETLLARLGMITFAEDAILRQRVVEIDNGYFIAFSLDTALTNDFSTAIAAPLLSDFEALNFSELNVFSEITAEGEFTSTNIGLHLDLITNGTIITAQISIHLNILQVGGVSIDFSILPMPLP